MAPERCTHCGEAMPQPMAVPARESPPEVREPSAVVESWKSVGVALVMFAALVTGGRFTVSHWPEQYVLRYVPPSAAGAVTAEPGEVRGAPSAGPTPDVTLTALLDDIQNTRTKLPDTLGDCSTVASDLPVLREVTEERRRQADAAATVDVGDVSNGAEMQGALVDMTRLALAADE
ncbi:hypothetical protein, partial [Actinomadura sp. CNU-125]|uniref:hypothetical protein n=1 Tax=Actinomadura sp. CNU-125 TaxID=1904961 RepID=UPI0011775AE7